MSFKVMRKKSYSSLRNALRLLNLFTMDELELTLSELADRLGVSLSTAHRLTSTLLKEGFLTRDPLTKSFRLAATILAMGNTVISQIDLCHYSAPILEKLSKDSGETSHIAVLKDTEIVYLLKMDSTYPVHLLTHAGRRNPVHCTSTGKVLLAHQEERIITEVIDHGLDRYTDNTIVSATKLRQILKQICQDGVALSVGELYKGITSISAPVKQPSGKVVAAIGIAGPSSRINAHTIPQFSRLVKHAAQEISRKIAPL